MNKCDLCYDYREEGLNPACVSACPSRALDWGPIKELREKYGDLDAVAPLPDPAITHPHLVINPYKDAQAWNEATGKISDPQEV